MSEPRLRSVFFGTPDFAVPIAEATAAVTDLVAVVTQPDRPKGRGRELASPPVKELALARGLPVFQPAKLRDGVLAAELERLKPDVAVVAAYGRILPKDLLDLPRFGCVNVHGSILPKYRGAAPIQWAIASCEAETGVTMMRMDEGLDTGDMLAILTIPIGPDDTGGSMHDKLAVLGGEIIREELPRYLSGALKAVPQDHASATMAPILSREQGRLDFTLPARILDCRIRGFSPWPGAFTSLDGGLLKVIRAKAAESPEPAAAPGTVVSLRPLLIAASEGSALELVEVQPEGRRVMTAAELVAGRRIELGKRLGSEERGA
ncbi:methionyl-tRNA formyltransferase [Vulgatibacter incomptus]|uniref:Methionyl-tRNA formyltransferase n=1 Tax=Vulgatibacter incomptus TaxID=1391653 RepID=A0A0K1PI49_9BACT|nr:methionyl-tRNA formyltransferase [Vulgatibacter incomptus]AKU92779.1 Methionyl-tRNA formyltransferase [Vulgatibacter incomptus]